MFVFVCFSAAVRRLRSDDWSRDLDSRKYGATDLLGDG